MWKKSINFVPNIKYHNRYMGIFSFFKKKEDAIQIGGMQDYMMLIRVYFQAAIAAQVGITNIAVLPDLRVFKSTFKVRTEHNKLGLGEKNHCKKMLKQMKDYILKRTQIRPSVLNRQKCHDWELDARYCLDHGVCDQIVEKLSDII